MNLRIALCGPGGSGKTTLAHELSRVLSLPMISECIRTSMRELGAHDLSAISPELRMSLQFMALSRQVQSEAQLSCSGFVSDRSIHDYLSYFRGFFREPLDALAAYKHIALASPGYTHLICVMPHSGPHDADGVRLSPDSPVEHSVALEMVRRVSAIGPSGLLLKSDSVEDRVREALEFIRKGT